ncbi:MAG: methylenetetrahydrofolate reductase [Xanthobacteraceae bacterium]
MNRTAPDLPALLSSASVEISSGGRQVEELRDTFAPGTDVTITFLPGDDYRHNTATAADVRRAGFNPVPHISAREMASRQMLDDFLARARGEADVSRVVIVAGDVSGQRGPFRSSLDICMSGSIEAHGIGTVSVAGHPEGHPYLNDRDAVAELLARRDWARGAGVRINIISQFCFEGAPILDWIQAIRAGGVDVPVIVGLAGPATPAILLKFALRCGVGTSIRSLRNKIGRFGRLMIDTEPDDVLRELSAERDGRTAEIAGFHFFPFGGLRKTGNWLRSSEFMQSLRRGEQSATPVAKGQA